MEARISTHQWLEIPQDVRYIIARELNLKKSTGRVVHDNKTQSDGHTYEDLAILNVVNLQAYLGSNETELYRLMDELVVILTPKSVEVPKVDLEAQHISRLKLNLEELQRQAYNLGLKSQFNDLLSNLIGVKTHEQPVQVPPTKATEAVQGSKVGIKKAKRNS